MRFKLQLLPLLGIYFLLISATYVKKIDTAIVSKENITITDHANSRVLNAHKLNFFQRLVVKFLIKKNKLLNSERADKLASTSLLLGIIACGSIILGLVVPFLILAAIPAGIAAMITGGSAERNKTTMIGKARTGKGLGLGALIAFALLLILAAIIVAAIVA